MVPGGSVCIGVFRIGHPSKIGQTPLESKQYRTESLQAVAVLGLASWGIGAESLLINPKAASPSPWSQSSAVMKAMPLFRVMVETGES